jgi:hypothetical protein
MNELSPLVGEEPFGAAPSYANHPIIPSGGISRASSPCLKRVPESTVRVVAIVGYGTNAFVPPT